MAKKPKIDLAEKPGLERVKRYTINKLEIKYDPAYHISLLFDTFSEGKTVAEFCAEAEICRATFYNWLNEHSEFSRAYDKARMFAQAHWELYGRTGALLPGFNTTYWSMVMRNRFGYTEHRRLQIPGLKKAKDFTAQHRCLLNHIAEGDLTASEAGNLSNLILSGAKIDELTTMKQDVDMLKKVIEGKKK